MNLSIKNFFRFIRNNAYLLILKRIIPTFVLRLISRRRCVPAQIQVVNNSVQKANSGVEITPFKYGADGCLCISIDFEMGLGMRYVAPSLANSFAKLERENTEGILKVFDDFLIPATWAITGHLFLDKCRRDRNSGLAHPDMPRIGFHKNEIWNYSRGDWYDGDPCSSWEKNKIWYAPDLIENILNSKPAHEIATHSFSHIDFSNCSDRIAFAEVSKCKELTERIGKPLLSMVFPGNFIGNLKTLSQLGLLSYREGGQGLIQYPVKTSFDLWNIPASMQLAGRLREKELRSTIEESLSKAIEAKGVFHLWFHPFEVDKQTIKRVLAPVLSFADTRRKQKKLWIATMADIANYCSLRESCDFKVEDSGSGKIDIVLKGKAPYGGGQLSIKVPRSREVTINGNTLSDYQYYESGQSYVVTVELNQ